MNLLIHADPGARSGFVGSWLTNSLVKTSFDAGMELAPRFTKIHSFVNDGKNKLKKFSGTKIRIRPTLVMVDNHILLFLKKNVHANWPDFTRDEYGLETFSKLWMFIKECFEHDAQVDYSQYDHVINFEDTYSLEKMTELYQKVLSKNPSNQEIEIFEETNKINLIPLDPNHSASLVKFILEQEQLLQVTEQQRQWSIVDIYKNTPINQLREAVGRVIIKENYGAIR